MYLEKDELGIGIGIGVAVVIIGYFLYKKSSRILSTKDELENSEEIKKAIYSFIEDIISDYYKEYRINYLGVRYNIKDLATENTYVFRTKRIGSLSNIVDYNQVSTGENYLNELIAKNYSIDVPVSEQLEFITEISRIEGKIRAVESVKAQLPEEDYIKLMGELEEDLIYYKEKYSTAV